jgi:hypothetical protein
MMTELDLINQLTATGDYKVIRRLKPVDRYHDDTGAQKHIGIYLDTETTGMGTSTDKVIELAMNPCDRSQTYGVGHSASFIWRTAFLEQNCMRKLLIIIEVHDRSQGVVFKQDIRSSTNS